MGGRVARSHTNRGGQMVKSSEGWSGGIPPFGFAQGRLSRKTRETWGTPFSFAVEVSSLQQKQVPPLRFAKRRNDIKMGMAFPALRAGLLSGRPSGTRIAASNVRYAARHSRNGKFLVNRVGERKNWQVVQLNGNIVWGECPVYLW